MAKRFSLPPPLHGSEHARRSIHLKVDPDATPEDREREHEKIARACDESGHTETYTAVCRKFLPYIDEIATRHAETIGAETGEEGYTSANERMQNIALGLAFFYVGRRTGFVAVNIQEVDSGKDDSSIAISFFLDKLMEAVGEKQATQIYRKLERMTDAVLEKQFGKSK